jgi:hypothetical protein
MDLFRRIVLAALCAGTLSGFVITMAHQVGTVPIILEAEVFDRAAEQPMDLASPADPAASVHHEEVVAWEPADGLERTVYTGLADVLTGIGFALLLVSAYSMTGTGVGWGKGALGLGRVCRLHSGARPGIASRASRNRGGPPAGSTDLVVCDGALDRWRPGAPDVQATGALGHRCRRPHCSSPRHWSAVAGGACERGSGVTR